MYGTEREGGGRTQPRVEQSLGDDDLLPLARRLNREFNAPVGLLDPLGAWQVRHGAAVEAFPHGGVDLLTGLTTLGLGQKRVVVWRPDREGSETETIARRKRLGGSRLARPAGAEDGGGAPVRPGRVRGLGQCPGGRRMGTGLSRAGAAGLGAVGGRPASRAKRPRTAAWPIRSSRARGTSGC